MVRYILSCSLLILYACSGGGSDGAIGSGSPPVGTANYLNPIGFTSDVLAHSPRLVAYSKKANRLSVIDPTQRNEIWGREARGFDFAVKLPDLDGAALFKARQVVIMTQSIEKAFSINQDYIQTSISRTNTAYSLASVDGTSFELIRSLGNGDWQHETFTVPWGAVDPAVSVPPANQPVLLATYFSDDGTLLAALSPSDGRYAVYTAASASDPILDTSTWCAGDGIGTPNDASYRSIAWDDSLKVFYVGDKNGRIYVVDPSGPCATTTTVPTLDLPDTIAVSHLTVYSAGRFGAIQDEDGINGSVYTIQYDGSALSREVQTYPAICQAPLSSLLLSGNAIMIMCTTDSALETDTKDVPLSKSVYIEPRQYFVMDMSNGELIYQKTIDASLSAGVGIDTDKNILYRMQEGAFGTLEITNLITGNVETATGLYIQGLLD